MNLDIFHQKDPSGKFSSKKYLEKNYPEELNEVLTYAEKYNITEIPFKEQVYLFKKGINNVPLCKNPNCDKQVKYRNSSLGYRDYCSNKCISSDPNIKKLKEEHFLEKYGTKTPSENREVKKKIIETNTEKYGGNSPMSNKSIQKKSNKTLLDNYGVDNPSKNIDIVEKRVKSFKNNIEQYKESYKKTSLERYGKEHPWMDSNIHEKGIQKSLDKKIEKYKIKILKILPSGYKLIDIKKENGLDNRTSSTIICDKSHETTVYNELLYNRIKTGNIPCLICNPKYTYGDKENKLKEFIESIYDGEIVYNSRNVIYPKEIDIFLPEINLAIEFNGLYWHSELHKDQNYHSEKTNMCIDNNINLLHIWEDDWDYKTDIIKSMIRHKLMLTNNRIFSRKCDIREIKDNILVKNFLNENHIQGWSVYNVAYGLFYNEELVSVMTFSKPRSFMKHSDSDDKVELARFCNKLETHVVGSAGRLFKNFIKHNSQIKVIYTFSDRSHSNGNLYEKLGFKYSMNSGNSYSWVLNDKRHHRYNFRKDRLIKMGYDPNKSEKDIMYEDVGAYRIWNSGQDKWEFLI